MKKKGILLLCVFILMNLSVGFAGRLEPVELDSRLQLIVSNEFNSSPMNHYGMVDFLKNGNFAMAASNDSKLTLHQYDLNGNRVAELAGSVGSFMEGPTFVIQAGNGKLYTTDGNRLWQSDAAMQEFVDEGQASFTTGVFRDGGTEIGYSGGLFGRPGIHFLNYKDSGNPADLEKNISLELAYEEIESCIPQGHRFIGVAGFDYGDSEEELYLLVSTGVEMPEAYYVMEVKKTIARGEEENTVQLSFVRWTKLDLPEYASVSDLVVTGRGFEVAGLEGSQERKQGSFANRLYQFDFSGVLQESISLPGMLVSFDSNGMQSAIVLWNGPEFGNALYLVNWNPASSGTPKRLISERSVNGKTVARFRDDGYGLLKTKVNETGLVDYLAPLKTEESDVKLQIPLEDLVAKRGENARDLVILFGEDRISMPMSLLDGSELLGKLPCQEDATIEIHLNRLEDGAVEVTVELFVIEQVDEMTKRVHRVKMER